MTLCSQARFSSLKGYKIHDRGSSSPLYIFEVVPPTVDVRFGDFWVEAQTWTCSTKFDVQLQRTISITHALSRAGVWRENLFCDADVATPNKALFATVRSILRSIENFGVESVDLSSVNLRASHPKHLIAVLRATYAWKNMVPGWSEALRIAPEILDSHGINSKRELSGLNC